MMNCLVIRDLLPLYVDGCCSEESAACVSEHLECCADCRKIHAQMAETCPPCEEEAKPLTFRRISDWKASLLQSVMLFVSFAILAVGVLLEGNTPEGSQNGLWAVAMIVPATGYLLSIAHWFFVRVYKTKKGFSSGSCVATLIATLLGYTWALVHYADGIGVTTPHVWMGVSLSLVFCVLSKVLSDQYARLLGKE